MPRISDVATAAGVSTATVSRVLNHKPVRPSTEGRVLEAIKSLQYTPDALAKGLRSRRAQQVGVIVPDISVEYYMELVKGIENTAMASGYNLIICDAQNSAEREIEYMSLLFERRLDGLISVGSSLQESQIAGLAARGFPLVLVGRDIAQGSITSVCAANKSGAYLATEHLLGHGHTRIAYIRGIPGQDDEERFLGYQAALSRHNVTLDESLVEWGGFTEEGGAKAMERLMERLSDRTTFTAVFAANDEMAVGAMDAARARKLRIPEDLAVVGFDDIRLARHIGLTTVNQPKYQMGATAVEKLLDTLKHGRSSMEKVVLRTELVLRRSCGCV